MMIVMPDLSLFIVGTDMILWTSKWRINDRKLLEPLSMKKGKGIHFLVTVQVSKNFWVQKSKELRISDDMTKFDKN
jgi:hypothetical protein